MINSSPQTMIVFVNGKTINVTYVVQDGKVHFLNAEGNAVVKDQIENEQQIKEEIEATLAEIEQAKEIVEKKVEEEIQRKPEVVEEKTEEAQQTTQNLNEADETRQKDVLEQQEKAEETCVKQEEKAAEAVAQEEERVKSVLEEQEKAKVEEEEKIAETTDQETSQNTSSSEEQKNYIRYPFPEYKSVEEIVDRIDETHFKKHVVNRKEFENESYGEKVDIHSLEDYQQHAADTLMDPQTEFYVGEKGNNENTLFAYNDQT